jgi:hypothetical protein
MKPTRWTFALVILIGTVFSQAANADFFDNSGTWRTEASNDMRLGYIMGITAYLSMAVDSSPNSQLIQAGYSKCLRRQMPDALLLVVDAYMDRTPSSFTELPTVTIVKALRQMCDPFMPKPPKTQ